MKSTTILALKQINQRFYENEAESFNQTRQEPWPGWEYFFNLVSPTLPSMPKILDLGCGNGRFGLWVAHKLNRFEYTGSDNSAKLLDFAATKLKKYPVSMILGDARAVVCRCLKDHRKYDLIVIFGLIHHLPGKKERFKLVKQCIGLLNPGGYLGLTIWKFLDDTKLKRRLAEPPPELSDLENGDYFLKWQHSQNLRYCHYVDEIEEKDMVNSIGLPVQAFNADGRNNKINRYLVFYQGNKGRSKRS